MVRCGDILMEQAVPVDKRLSAALRCADHCINLVLGGSFDAVMSREKNRGQYETSDNT